MRAVIDEVAARWPASSPTISRLSRLPAWSTIITRRGLMFCPIGRRGETLIGIGAYVIDDGTPHHWGAWSSFLGEHWQKVLAMPTRDYLIATGDRGALLSGLGRLAAVTPQDVAAVISARSPQVLRASAPELARISSALGLPVAVLGVYGSALYKRAELRSDFDFVVYGEANARMAHRKVRMRLAEGETYMRGNVAYHLRFQLPGADTWYDPRYWRPEPFTAALAAGEYKIIGSEDIDQVEITDDRYGIFTPSIYGLADGTRLLSYRLGHAAYPRPGDRVTASKIPVYELCGATYRAILGYEDLRRDQG